MARQPKKCQIHVEGRNDQFALINLLVRHGINYDPKPWPDSFPEFTANTPEKDDLLEPARGVEAMLQTIVDEIKLQAGRTVGFVLDADTDPQDRWKAIQTRLQQSGVLASTEQSPEGFIGESSLYKTRVGVWLMPDNRSPGALEHFLATLIPDSNGLYQEAEAVTRKILEQYPTACFREIDQLKAQIACWLAWQKNPGRPYGTAIRARYFESESPDALRFVHWFKTLFQIP